MWKVQEVKKCIWNELLHLGYRIGPLMYRLVTMCCLIIEFCLAVCVSVCDLIFRCCVSACCSFTLSLSLTLCVILSPSSGQGKKSSPKKPRGRNIFKALFCCLHAQDAAQTLPPPHDALLPTEENGSITKVKTLMSLILQAFTRSSSSADQHAGFYTVNVEILIIYSFTESCS